MEFLPESPSERAAFEKERGRWPRIEERRPNRWPVEADETSGRKRARTIAAIGVGLVAGLAVSAIVTWPARLASSAVVIRESTVTLTSVPEGAAVYIDGSHAGKTPLSLSLPVGTHVAELRSGTTSRRASLTIEAGKILTQHVDFGGAPATGGLHIASEPQGAQVSIDGTLRGVTPLNVPEIAPGEHRLTISTGRTSVNRTVAVTAGATATVVVSVPVAPTTGWVAIDAPIDVDVFEGDRLLGSGRVSRIALSAGRHTLELVNRQVGFRTQTTVDVPNGRAVALNVPMPGGSLSISAFPWADVSVDGRAIGQTPIGNLSVSLGTHEVVWRHPDHGERRQMVLVSATEPVRLGIDWTR